MMLMADMQDDVDIEFKESKADMDDDDGAVQCSDSTIQLTELRRV